ncbi:unnamed protein product [Brassica rapa subsp. trilocularis]
MVVINSTFLLGSQNGVLRFTPVSRLVRFQNNRFCRRKKTWRERELKIEATRTWFCEKTKFLVSDTIGVSFPIKDGIPCLVPKDGKILDDDGDASKAS